MRLFTKLGLGAVFAAGLSTFAMADEGANGIWIMQDGKVTVRIAPCGPNLCGSIVGLAKPTRNGKPKVDKENPNASLRNRPLMGLTVLSNMEPRSENSWAGKIYNADDGRTYSSYMKLLGDKMKVQGCVGPFCKSIVFVRSN